MYKETCKETNTDVGCRYTNYAHRDVTTRHQIYALLNVHITAHT